MRKMRKELNEVVDRIENIFRKEIPKNVKLEEEMIKDVQALF